MNHSHLLRNLEQELLQQRVDEEESAQEVVTANYCPLKKKTNMTFYVVFELCLIISHYHTNLKHYNIFNKWYVIHVSGKNPKFIP